MVFLERSLFVFRFLGIFRSLLKVRKETLERLLDLPAIELSLPVYVTAFFPIDLGAAPRFLSKRFDLVFDEGLILG